MATIAPVKRETLKSIDNVPDWVLRQRIIKDKKDLQPTKQTRPRVTLKPKKISVPSAAQAVIKPVCVPQLIKEEVNGPKEVAQVEPSSGAKTRRIYSREFLVKFRYSVTPFPPGVPTPAEIVAQYNKDFELRERVSQENAAKNTSPASPTAQAFEAVAPSETAPAAAPERKMRRKKEGEATTDATPKREKTFKLRGLTTNESILNSPLFRASAAKSPTPKRSASPSVQHKGEDKENPSAATTASKLARSASASRRAPSPLVSRPETANKKTKLSSTTPSTTTAPFASVITTATPAPQPAPTASVAVAAAAAPTTVAEVPIVVKEEVAAAAESVVVEKTEDLVDALTKKLKSALKETDTRRLAQRQKQIEYGKATAGYKDYSKLIAKSKRKREDPKTPNKYQVCSKRSWDGQIRKWRRMLHFYDPAELKEANEGNSSSSSPCAEGDVDMDGGKEPKSFEITAADIQREEAALLE